MTTDIKVKAPKKRKNASLDKRKARGGWLFVLPFVIGFVLIYLPIIIDSIQTMYRDDMPSSPGSVPQVRECTSHLMQLAKGREIPIFIVGHVNKEGSIAGPKVMEHMVDAVLYIEGNAAPISVFCGR